MPMISLQIDQTLQERLDQIQKKLGYASRSECLRESIQAFIRANQDESSLEGHRIANITVYHAMREDILNKFTFELQKYENIIKTIDQYNLKNVIIKSLLVAGPGDEINDLFKTLSSDRLFKCTITFIIIPDKFEDIEPLEETDPSNEADLSN